MVPLPEQPLFANNNSKTTILQGHGLGRGHRGLVLRRARIIKTHLIPPPLSYMCRVRSTAALWKTGCGGPSSVTVPLKVNKLTFTIRASDSSWHPGLPWRPLFTGPRSVEVFLWGKYPCREVAVVRGYRTRLEVVENLLELSSRLLLVIQTLVSCVPLALCAALKERCPPRQKSRVERLKAKVEPLLTYK